MPNGYATLRGIPIPKNKRLKSKKQYYLVLESFFKKNTLCNNCNGLGYTVEEDIKPDQNEFFSIKFEGIEELENLKLQNVKLADKIKQILQTEFCKRKACKTCYGSGFIKKKKA